MSKLDSHDPRQAETRSTHEYQRPIYPSAWEHSSNIARTNMMQLEFSRARPRRPSSKAKHSVVPIFEDDHGVDGAFGPQSDYHDKSVSASRQISMLLSRPAKRQPQRVRTAPAGSIRSEGQIADPGIPSAARHRPEKPAQLSSTRTTSASLSITTNSNTNVLSITYPNESHSVRQQLIRTSRRTPMQSCKILRNNLPTIDIPGADTGKENQPPGFATEKQDKLSEGCRMESDLHSQGVQIMRSGSPMVATPRTNRSPRPLMPAPTNTNNPLAQSLRNSRATGLVQTEASSRIPVKSSITKRSMQHGIPAVSRPTSVNVEASLLPRPVFAGSRPSKLAKSTASLSPHHRMSTISDKCKDTAVAHATPSQSSDTNTIEQDTSLFNKYHGLTEICMLAHAGDCSSIKVQESVDSSQPLWIRLTLVALQVVSLRYQFVRLDSWYCQQGLHAVSSTAEWQALSTRHGKQSIGSLLVEYL